MKVVVSGAYGFIGKNLCLRLNELPGMTVVPFGREDSLASLWAALDDADALIHLAGVNRPQDPASFDSVNVDLTKEICDHLKSSSNSLPVLFTSSIQAEMENFYGRSKRAAEQVVETLSTENRNPVAIYRLPGVFGKWCKPNYNSVVATFCHNLANDLPIHISDPDRSVKLVYIDDVIDSFISWLRDSPIGCQRPAVDPEYTITLGQLADQISAFKNCRTSLVSERVGTGLVRALYATYVSYLPTQKFMYDLPVHGDQRGVFVEMLKTRDSGQFSFFTAHPGVTRGGHYHHTKTEKFLVIKGLARFGFRHMNTGEQFFLDANGERPQIVETVPGWTHDITNIGDSELIVMLWANETFDRDRPDTIACKVKP